MNAILGFADVLLYGTAGPLTDKQRGYVQRMVEAGERQLEIIDNLVELSRIHAEESVGNPKVTDPLRILENCVGQFEPKASARGVSIILDAEADLGPVHVDPDGLERALGNLLSNAIRHLEEGGVVRVAASREEFDDVSGEGISESIRICVADSGPGIAPEDQAVLFQDLNHGEAFAARRKQRNGTGLPLARRLLERDGGRIEVKSSGRKGEGSRFVVTVPIVTQGIPGALEVPTSQEATGDGGLSKPGGRI